jgi:hypothetical protein
MLLRGATKHLTMGGFSPKPRTDLMLDLDTQRAGGFFSVLEMDDNADSILELVLRAGRDQKTNRPSEKYVSPEKYQCVTHPEKFNALNAEDQKRIGMPYYTSQLSDDDYNTLIAWLQKGAQLPKQSEIDARMLPKNPNAIQKWENFLNAPTWKARWTSRYLYEHLFTAHLYFDESPGEFYELVRSETAAPKTIVEIASERPFSIPEAFADRFYYRVRKVQQTIVYKQHFIYPINKGTISELQKLFWESKWLSKPEVKPFGFTEKNPFIAFEHIPANSRYRWLLKNARMLLDMDMRSDNCHGEGASGPLRDSFLVLFLKPESDVTVQFSNFFKSANSYLDMTNVSLSNIYLQSQFQKNQVEFSKVKQRYQGTLRPNGFMIDDIWDGEQGTQMPLFTVNRHEKTVSVHDGAWGPMQKVTLLFDFASFERLYYNCVALTTLFDAMKDKMGTVFYLRDMGREIEEQMLSFLPEQYRNSVRAEWIQGLGAQNRYDDSRFILPFNKNLNQLSGFTIDPKQPFASLMNFILLKSGRFSKEIVGKNHYPSSQGTEEYQKLKTAGIFMSQKQDQELGHRAHYFPNVSYLIVKAQKDLRYYTLVANRYYKYVNYISYNPNPADRLGRDGLQDWMSVYPEIEINYPGKIYQVDAANFDQFIADLKSVNNVLNYKKFDETYGLQKMSTEFWDTIDKLQDDFIKRDPIYNGLLDLGEYGTHDLLGSP